MFQKKRALASEIAIGISAALIALGIRWALPLQPDQLPTALVVIALALVGTFIGVRAGIVTAVAGGAASWYLFFNPMSWSLANGAWVPLLGFAITAAAILTTSELFRTSERIRLQKEVEAAAWLGGHSR